MRIEVECAGGIGRLVASRFNIPRCDPVNGHSDFKQESRVVAKPLPQHFARIDRGRAVPMLRWENPAFDARPFWRTPGWDEESFQLAPKMTFFTQGDPADSVLLPCSGGAQKLPVVSQAGKEARSTSSPRENLWEKGAGDGGKGCA